MLYRSCNYCFLHLVLLSRPYVDRITPFLILVATFQCPIASWWQACGNWSVETCTCFSNDNKANRHDQDSPIARLLRVRQDADRFITLTSACSHRAKEWSAPQNREMSFDLECDELTSTIRGSGRDNVGSFVILGLFNEQTIRFIKSYSDGSQREQWTYIGQRCACDAQNLMVFKGGWGTGGKQHGSFVLAGSFFSLAGQWGGHYHYYYDPTVIDAPMDIRLEVDAKWVHGSGSDQWGHFNIEGKLRGCQFDATKTYESGTLWRWWAIVTARGAKISGSWGGSGHEGGTFQITKKPTGEPTPTLSAEVALTLLRKEEELCGGMVEQQLALKVGEELGSSILQTLVTGFISFA